MKGLIKTFIAFIYIVLALFIQQGDILACENITQNTSRYYISSTKNETALINNKEEEFYAIFLTRNKSEISNSSNRNNIFGFSGFDKTNFNYNVFIRSNVDNSIYPIRISYNISPNLKNAIYTRAP